MNPMQSPNVGPGGAQFGGREKRRQPAIKAGRKLSFNEALQAINEERHVRRHQVQAAALQRSVWVAEWHLPGCLSESRSYCTTKAGAADAALDMAETESGPPVGMAAAFKQAGDRIAFHHHTGLYGNVVTTIERHTLADLLG